MQGGKLKMTTVKHYIIFDDHGNVVVVVRAANREKAIKKYIKGTQLENYSKTDFLALFDVEEVKVI